MAARIDIPSVYDEVRKAYAGMGYPVSGDRLVLAEYLAKQVSDRLGKRASAAEFRDGTYDDVKAVYDSLTDDEKDFVTPRRRVYKDVPPLARTVAYSDGVPVGFADLYGQKGRASLCLAVAKAARGKGLAGEMARTSIRKLLNAMAEEKCRAAEVGGNALEDWRKQSRIRRFVWGLDARNDRSARAAARAGFTEQEFKKPHKYRRFVMTRGEAERMRDRLEKQAGMKPPTSIETVRKLIGALKRKGLKRVSIAEIFASRPRYSLFRGSNALPAHAHRVPVKGEFARNLVDGVRYEHYTPFPEEAHEYGKYLTVTDISKEKGLMSSRRGLTSDFHAMDQARMAAGDPEYKTMFGAEYTKFIAEHPEYFSEFHGITRGGDGKLRAVLSPGGDAVRDNFFETTIPARYADRHSKVYMAVPGESPYRERTLENGGLFIPPKSFIDEYRRLNPGSSYADRMVERGAANRTRSFSTNRDYHFYDMSPIQRLVKIMHRHPEYRAEIEPVVSKYLGIDKSYMAGL